MIELKPEIIIKVLGIVTVLYWLSLSFYLPPFSSKPNFNGLATSVSAVSEITKYIKPELNSTKHEFVEKLKSDYRNFVLRQYVILVIGIISGVLVFLHSRVGRYLSIGICSSWLLYKIINISKSYPHVIERTVMFFTQLMPNCPLLALHDIFGVLFSFSTIFLLMKKQISAYFRKPSNT